MRDLGFKSGLGFRVQGLLIRVYKGPGVQSKSCDHTLKDQIRLYTHRPQTLPEVLKPDSLLQEISRLGFLHSVLRTNLRPEFEINGRVCVCVDVLHCGP